MYGPKIGGLRPLLGEWELSPNLTQCRVSGGQPPTKWHFDPSSHLATRDMGRKLGALSSFEERGCWFSINNVARARPTCTPSFILIRPTVWPQYSNVTDRQAHRQHRQDRQTNNFVAAKGERFYKRSPKIVQAASQNHSSYD